MKNDAEAKKELKEAEEEANENESAAALIEEERLRQAQEVKLEKEKAQSLEEQKEADKKRSDEVKGEPNDSAMPTQPDDAGGGANGVGDEGADARSSSKNSDTHKQPIKDEKEQVKNVERTCRIEYMPNDEGLTISRDSTNTKFEVEVIARLMSSKIQTPPIAIY